MALRIVNNLAAMNTQRWLGVSDAGMKKSLERLSSGYRINRAADDAAGLAISQAFRANIASYKVASRNASEANALLQVAEGGMDQIGNMLTRLKELATQASSANVGSSERAKIDAEGDALLSEIDRIANSSKYGSTSLLDGTFGASMSSALAYTAGSVAAGIVETNVQYVFENTWSAALTSSDISVTAIGSNVIEGVYCTVHTGATVELYNSGGTMMDSFTSAVSTNTGSTITFANLGITIALSGSMTGLTLLSALDGFSLTIERTSLTGINAEAATTGTYTFSDTGGTLRLWNSAGTLSESAAANIGSYDFTSILGISFTLGANYDSTDLDNVTLTVTSSGATGNTFQIGAENNTDNQISISVAGTRKTDLGLDNLDLAETANAQAALDLIDTAIGSLAGSRGDVGASMNRLAYASANLATTIENQQAAESVIRDVDMANEMTMFTKNQILLQAGTAMLAQANMAPQQVLALFG
jgi:flagellin